MSSENMIPEQVQYMAQRVKEEVEAGAYDSFCVVGGEPVFFVIYSHALIPGHIYSREGVDEYRISKCCEYHFDKAFAEEE